MSYLVHEFLIEPVLRQARQLSRSSAPRDSIPNLTAASLNSHGNAIDDTTTEHYRGSQHSDTSSLEAEDSNSGAPSNASLIYSSNLTTSQLEIDPQAENLEPSNSSWPSGNVDSFQEVLQFAVTEPPDRIIIPNRSRASSLSMTNTSAESNFHDTLHDSRATWPHSSDIVSHRLALDEAPLMGTTLHPRTTSLPEDDGMKALRQQILTVQAMNISPEQKARRMHHLLNRDYIKAKTKPQTTISTPPYTISQERPTTPGSLSFFLWQMNGSPESTVEQNCHTYQLSPEDLRQTYVPLELLKYDDCWENNSKDEAQVLGCRHYQRNVKLECSACKKWYTCRLCHDEVEDHILNRKATKNMLCMICGCAQKAGEFCAECGERTAWYYCDVCKLWDNDTRKNIYHCHDCGICRKGLGIGKDFFHCKTCGTCMSTSVEHSHKCIERVSDCDCPICGEYMFTSPSPVVFMLCGHSIHKACYDEYLKSSYKCPICSKSTVNMETQFRNLDRAVESQPMPPQFRDTKALVSCNDCYAKSVVIYHWLGLKCAICDSYNTAKLSVLSGPAVVAESIEGNFDLPQEFATREVSTSIHLPALIRPRRHSTFIQVAESNDRRLHRFSPLPRLQRIGRSVSPIAGLRFYEEGTSPHTAQTNDSAIEDELDFWGLDEPPALVSGGSSQDEIDEEESGDDSALEDCDDEGEEEDDDDFVLFGHR